MKGSEDQRSRSDVFDFKANVCNMRTAAQQGSANTPRMPSNHSQLGGSATGLP